VYVCRVLYCFYIFYMSYKSPSPSSIMTLLLATLPFFYTHTHTHHVARVNNPDHPIIAHIFINHNHHHHHHFHHNNHHQQSSPCVSIDVIHSFTHTHTHIMSSESTIQIIPLGGGRDVGRSCILTRFKDGKTVMFDCGVHMGT
jgi:hypothetical protein